MQIEFRLDKDFERFFEKMKEEYGEDFTELNGLDDNHLSPTSFLDSFVESQTVADSSVDGSSNVVQKDIVTLRSEKSKAQEKLMAYFKIFLEMKQKYGLRHAKKWFELEWNKALYMHDANTCTMIPYCFAYDLKRLAEEGLFNLPDHTQPEPAKHLETFVDFVKEFISFASNRTSGACGLPNLIPYLYYFWREDCKNGIHGLKVIDGEQFAKSEIQRLIYAMNQPYCRDGIQSAFINTSIFDHEYFEALFGGMEFPDGTFAIDEEEEIMQFQKWFLEEMKDIKDKGRMFTFPVNTISLLRKDGKFVDEDFARWASNHNRTWNDSNIFMDDSVTSLSNCCRLKSNIKDLGYFKNADEIEELAYKKMYEDYCAMMTYEEFKLYVKGNTELEVEKKHIMAEIQNNSDDERFGGLGYFSSIGGSALKVGSVKVSTINFARIAYESNGNEKKYLEILRDRLQINLEVLDVVRDIIKKNVDRGLLPNFCEGMIDFEHLYNTVGVNGIYETIKTFGYTVEDEVFGNTLYALEGFEFGRKILETCHDVIAEFTKDKDYRGNIEQVPAEQAAIKFQKADKLLFPNKVVTDLPLYGNQWIPLGIKATLKDRINICSQFDKYCNGGSIMHINLDAPFTTEEQAWDMLNYIADKGVTYFAFNGKLSTDDNGHLFYGDICPQCGAHKTAEYTRTVGFFTKTACWSKERKAEFKQREWMALNDKGVEA